MSKILLSTIILYIVISGKLYSQNIAITDDETYTANNSAMLDVKSTSKGMLVPRLTSAQRIVMGSPATGLLVFDITLNSFMYWNGSMWTNLTSGSVSGLWGFNSPNVYLNNTNYRIGVGTTSPSGKMEVKADASITSNTPIFQVTNNNGDTVFAVYPQGVRINVQDDPGKASGNKGGFAVGGFTPSKGTFTNEYLRVTPDSVRVYIEEGDVNKASGNKGGFAVGGFTPSKIIPTDYFNIYGSTAATVVYPSEARIMWYPLKEAFLAGKIIVEKPDSVGLNSFSTGYLSRAKGSYSQAFGYNAIARGNYSTAIGKNAVANFENSFAFGDGAKALNQDAYAFGAFTEATGIGSFAFGYVGRDSLGPTGSVTSATGSYSFAFGYGSKALAKGAFAIGTVDTASGMYSLSMGYKTYVANWYSTAIGYKTRATGYSSMAMGNRSAAIGNFSNSFGYADTSNGEASLALGAFTKADGNSSTSLGYYTSANGNYSTAMGKGTSAILQSSTAMGEGTTAYGNWSTAMGFGTLADGDVSTAMGYLSSANADYSTAIGYVAIADGLRSTSIGSGTRTFSGYEVVVGRNNEEYTPVSTTGWNANDRLFVVGNGASPTAKSNALTILKNGDAGFGISNPLANVQVVGSDTLSTLLVTPGGITAYKSEIQLGENPTFSHGIKIQYDGVSNNLLIYGKSNTTIYGPHVTIGRDNGRVGIGRTSSANKLEVEGDASKTTAGSWLANSDKRIKKDIKDIDNSYETILKLRPVKFKYTDEWIKRHPSIEDKYYYNFIAQEYREVFPESVKGSGEFLENDPGEILQIDTYNAQILTIKAVQDLIKENQQLKEDFIILKNQLDGLKSENTELRNKTDEIELLKAELAKVNSLLNINTSIK